MDRDDGQGDWILEDEDTPEDNPYQGVSLLTGVIMMIAVTVILGAIVGSLFMGFSQSPQETDEHSAVEVLFNQNGISELEVVYEDGTADHLIVKYPDGVEILRNTGDSTVITDLENGDKIEIYAVENGKKTLVRTYTIS